MAQTQMSFFDEKNITTKTMEQVMHDSMMPYSEYVILDRALPRVEDGLKPVQRRVLYTMSELGLSPDKPYLKSARIVGDCLGKYHPHGDSSVYDAMVRMAQSFNMSAPLVDGQGNYGSVDGDTAAAMRYTEARLTPLALELIRDLDEDTCKWNLNYDDKLKEPDILPSRFPNILVNGASGIAVGLATNIPPHNLAEVIDGVVAMIDNPKITLANLMKIIKGPDFPTGGTVSAGDELYNAYSTGRGKLIMRAKLHIENEGNTKSIVVTELPYQINKATLQIRIQELREKKKDMFAGIADITDESDRTGMRVVIKLKKDADADAVLRYLLKYSDLETTYGVNMVAIANGRPQQMGLIDILNYYIEYQREFIVKRTQRDLKNAKKRAHILEGLLVAIQNIDAVIKIIKTSQSVSDARSALREAFDLSEEQAQAILEMQLRRLTSLEVGKLKEEIKELHALIERLSAILASKKEQMKVMREEILAVKKAHKYDRRTEVIENMSKMDLTEDDITAAKKEGVFCVNLQGLVKLVGHKNYSMAQTLAKDCGESEVTPIALDVPIGQNVLVITNKGNCCNVQNENLPEKKWREKGAKLSSLVDGLGSGERAVAAFATGGEDCEVYIYTEQGTVKRVNLSELTVAKQFYQVMPLKDGDFVVGAEKVQEGSAVFMGTESGIFVNVEPDGIPNQKRGAGGVRAMKVGEGDKVINAFQVDGEGEVVVVTEKGYAKRVVSAMLDVTARDRKGMKIAELGDRTGSKVMCYSYVKLAYDLVIITESGNTVAVNTEDITIESRTAKGKQPTKLSEEIRTVCRHYDNVDDKTEY